MLSLVEILKELTTPRSVLRDRISNQEDNVTLHVLKFLILGGENKEYWAKELRGFLSRLVSKQADTKKFPKAEIYKDLLFNPMFETYDEYLNVVQNTVNGWNDPLEDYADLPKTDIANKEHYQVVVNFYNVICAEMSQGKLPTATEIYKLLDV